MRAEYPTCISDSVAVDVTGSVFHIVMCLRELTRSSICFQQEPVHSWYQYLLDRVNAIPANMYIEFEGCSMTQLERKGFTSVHFSCFVIVTH